MEELAGILMLATVIGGLIMAFGLLTSYPPCTGFGALILVICLMMVSIMALFGRSD